jgi:hypothetical protein
MVNKSPVRRIELDKFGKALVKNCSMCYSGFITTGKSFAKCLQALRQAHFTFCRGGKTPLL